MSPGYSSASQPFDHLLGAPAEPSRASNRRGGGGRHRRETSSLRRLEQLARVAVRGLVAIGPAQHPDDLGDERIAVDSLDRGHGLPPPGALLDPEMRLSHRRDLREMGDAEDLALGPE